MGERVAEISALLEDENDKLEQERVEAAGRITEGIMDGVMRTIMDFRQFYDAGVFFHLQRIKKGVNVNIPSYIPFRSRHIFSI
jgi:hypothetical protein